MDLDHGAGHHVRIVEAAQMPCDKEFMFMECGGELWLALRADRLTERMLEECWATYRQMTVQRIA
jgi:hypothetical protein